MKRKVPAAIMAVVAILTFTGAIAAQADDEVRTDGAAMVAEAVRMEQLWAELFNNRQFEELGARYYAEDAILIPPNTEPVRGRADIVEYLRGIRDAFGVVAFGEPLRSSTSGSLVSLVGQGTGLDGRLRAVTHELYERQADGSLLTVHDAFNFRDPLR